MTMNAHDSRFPEAIIDMHRYPLADLKDARTQALIAAKRRDWLQHGTFNLEGFVQPEALGRCVAEIEPLMAHCSFHHAKEHNVYFCNDESVPAAVRHRISPLTTSNHTLCCDQLDGTLIRRIYEWNALPVFLAAVLDKPTLYRMADPLACLNVMGYGKGDRIGWHFDRAEFTVSMLLQDAVDGGVFQYRRGLRTTENPNYKGAALVVAGQDPHVRSISVAPGTLNVFAGYGSLHRTTPVEGGRMRLIAILSFMERLGVEFSAADRKQFYGRSEPVVPLGDGGLLES